MTFSIQRETSDGTLSTLDLTIEYIDQIDVRLFVDDVEMDLTGGTTPYTWEWVTPAQIKILPVVPDGSVVMLRRRTQSSEMYHNFDAGAVFKDESVDENFKQVLFLTQESQEGLALTDLFNDLDMHGFDILNLPDATNPQSPVTLAQLNNYTVDSAATLRQDLANATDPAKGAALAGRAGQVVDSVAAIRLLSKNSPSKTAFATAHTASLQGSGGGLYRLDLSDTASTDNNGSVIVANDGGRWKLPLGAVNVRQFGAKGDGVTNDTAAILAAVAALSTPHNNVLYFPYGHYRTSQTINVPTGSNTLCDPGVVFQRFGADKTFAAFQVNGGGREHYIGLIDAYKDGIVIKSSTNRVRFQRISNCTRGIVISATDVSSLDNKIDGVQIGLADEAIVFEQNGIRTQQGNEVRVNFVSESNHTLVFDDLGTHTKQSNWDSNFVELMASDPYYRVGSTLVRNKSGFPVVGLNYSVKTWAGGWNVDDGTITVISGSFAQSQYEFSFAASVSAADFVSASGRAGFPSCQCRLLRNQNLGAGTAYSAVASGEVFNGGVDLSVKRFRIAATVPALATGQTSVRLFKHVLGQGVLGGKFKIASVEANSTPYIISIRERGDLGVGWVGIGFYNPAAAVVATQTVNLIIEAGD
jgi:hypothetical protein